MRSTPAAQLSVAARLLSLSCFQARARVRYSSSAAGAAAGSSTFAGAFSLRVLQDAPCCLRAPPAAIVAMIGTGTGVHAAESQYCALRSGQALPQQLADDVPCFLAHDLDELFVGRLLDQQMGERLGVLVGGVGSLRTKPAVATHNTPRSADSPHYRPTCFSTCSKSS